MRILSWNCHGLENPWIGCCFRKLVREQAPIVCFLMETRLDKERFDKIYGNLPYQNKIIVKHPDLGGGLALLWKNDINMEVVNYTTNHVLAKIIEEDRFVWYMIGFYGWPNAQQKFKSWKLLAYLKNFVDGPWLCVGDFNAILNASEKLSIRQPQSSQINEFQEALELCQLEDLGYKGYPYTWTSKRPEDANTKMWVDRAVASKGGGRNFKWVQLCTFLLMLQTTCPLLFKFKHLAINNKDFIGVSSLRKIGSFGMIVRW